MTMTVDLSREVDRLVNWPNGIWSRRYQAILVSGEEEAQAGRWLAKSRQTHPTCWACLQLDRLRNIALDVSRKGNSPDKRSSQEAM
jgi:hypothetical protein